MIKDATEIIHEKKNHVILKILTLKNWIKHANHLVCFLNICYCNLVTKTWGPQKSIQKPLVWGHVSHKPWCFKIEWHLKWSHRRGGLETNYSWAGFIPEFTVFTKKWFVVSKQTSKVGYYKYMQKVGWALYLLVFCSCESGCQCSGPWSTGRKARANSYK